MATLKILLARMRLMVRAVDLDGCISFSELLGFCLARVASGRALFAAAWHKPVASFHAYPEVWVSSAQDYGGMFTCRERLLNEGVAADVVKCIELPASVNNEN